MLTTFDLRRDEGVQDAMEGREGLFANSAHLLHVVRRQHGQRRHW